MGDASSRLEGGGLGDCHAIGERVRGVALGQFRGTITVGIDFWAGRRHVVINTPATPLNDAQQAGFL